MASFTARSLAFGIDLGLCYVAQLGGCVFGAFVAAFFVGSHAPKPVADHLMNVGGVFGWLYWSGVYWILNYGVLQGMTGSTVGKWAVGLRVERRDGVPLAIGESLFRSVCYFASSFPFLAGFFSALWDRESLTWHDRICGTRVVVRCEALPRVIALPAPALEQEPRRAA